MTIPKLGMISSPYDAPRLLFSRYLDTAKLPPAPLSVNWAAAVKGQWEKLGNDTVGDCVQAGQLHLQQMIIANATGQIPHPTTADAIRLYSAETGYVKGHPATDRGTDPLTALHYWRNTGIGFNWAGRTVLRKIAGFAQVNLANIAELKSALWLFGGLFTGWLMPKTAQGQSTWSVPPGGPVGPGAPGSWGGHLAPLVMDSTGAYGVVSWGRIYPVTPGYLATYVAPNEVWVVLSHEWIEKNGKTPSGVDWAQLQADGQAL